MGLHLKGQDWPEYGEWAAFTAPADIAETLGQAWLCTCVPLIELNPEINKRKQIPLIVQDKDESIQNVIISFIHPQHRNLCPHRRR